MPRAGFRSSPSTGLKSRPSRTMLKAIGGLCATEGLPIATGENLHSLYEFKQMIASGGVTFPEADVTNCGGVTAFMKIAHMAEAFNLPITSHGAHDITIQLLAAVPNRSYLEVHGFGLERFLTHSLELGTGSLRRRSGRDTVSNSTGKH